MNTEQPFSVPDEVRVSLEQIAAPQKFPAHTVLFQRGDAVRGVYVICAGQVALSLPHMPDPPRIAGPGSVLGLPATMCAQPYSLTAETLEPVEAGFIPRDDFVALVKQRSEICLAVIETLASELYDARRQASALLDRMPVLT